MGSAIGRGGSWELPVAALGTAGLAQLLGVVAGIAFGLVFLSSPAAIVSYFVLPIAWSVVGGLVPALRGAAVWLDVSVATEPLATNTMTGAGWAHLATSSLAWIGLPLAAGYVRVQRSEPR